MEIAVYGKGGIGKSTVSANLSAALAEQGKRVLQIGCDPKHDSTRLLMHGRNVETVLDYLRKVTREEEKPEMVMHRGAFGTGCIEAGGPKPGVGCAGRGIISAFEFLARHRVKQSFEIVLYDVLGDVVCGGFAVPVRREYADAVFLVTSGEYMAIYAANNILRGIRNFDQDQVKRVAGIIYNERKLPGEDERIPRFAKEVHLPVCVKVPRSEGFAEAEKQKKPLMELEGYEDLKATFRSLAGTINEKMPLYEPRPLSDEDLEETVLGTPGILGTPGTGPSSQNGTPGTGPSSQNGTPGAGSSSQNGSPRAETASQKADGSQTTSFFGTALNAADTPKARELPADRPPLYGCAFNGAATTAVHLTDAVVIAHGPLSCAFYTLQNITSTGRKNLFNRGILMPSAQNPNFESSDIGHAEAVFGGMELLEDKVRQAVAKKPGCVVIVSSCTSGIIGDDISRAERLSDGEVPVIAVPADGVGAGDYMEGIRLCMRTLADRLIDRSVKPSGRKVNLINETGVSNNIAWNYRIVEDLLSRMDIEVNCRFLGNASTLQMKNFLAAPLNLLASDSEDSLSLKDYLTREYGCRFLDTPFPIGFEASSRWVRRLGSFFDRERKADEIIEQQQEIYRETIAQLESSLSGKRILLTTINANLDWLLSAAVQAGMQICWIGVLNYLNQQLCVTEHPDFCDEITSFFTPGILTEKIAEYDPDLIVTNYTQILEGAACLQDSIPMTPAAGFHSALHVLRRWAGLFETGEEGSWGNDREWFERYYS